MNILLIAPYRTFSGWGEGAKHLAKALNTLDHNLAIRPIYMSNEIDTDFHDEKLLELEKKQYPYYDVVIQRVLPPYFQPVPNSKNILVSVFETANIKTTPWWRHIKQADAVIVPSKKEKDTLIKDQINIPVYDTSEPIDIEKYKQEDYELIPELQNSFNFYFIGEFIERKNLRALIIAFHSEFQPNEPVNLVIKTSCQPHVVNEYLIDIKRNLRIYQSLGRYKREIIMINRFNDRQMHSLHKNCHCMVMPSYGEAFCRPVVDALGYGNRVIVNDNTGMTDYISNNGYVVKSRIQSVFTSQPPLVDIYTGKETWANIDTLDLQKKMRKAYQNKNKAHTDMEQFSYKTIGNKINQILNDLTN